MIEWFIMAGKFDPFFRLFGPEDPPGGANLKVIIKEGAPSTFNWIMSLVRPQGPATHGE